MNRLLSTNVFNLFKRKKPSSTTAVQPMRNGSTSIQGYKQDMPPAGGYQKIHYERVPIKTYFSGTFLFIGYVIWTFTWCYLWKVTSKDRYKLLTEEAGTMIVLQPMLIAEKDRRYLKILRRNRELEEEIMKDVPGWEVGTYFGEPIYHNNKPDEWHDVTLDELFLHFSNRDLRYHSNVNKYY